MALRQSQMLPEVVVVPFVVVEVCPVAAKKLEPAVEAVHREFVAEEVDVKTPVSPVYEGVS